MRGERPLQGPQRHLDPGAQDVHLVPTAARSRRRTTRRTRGRSAAEKTEPWPGAPIEPTGDPLSANVGPGSWTERRGRAHQTADGHDLLAPLRVATNYAVPQEGANPIGFEVVGIDGGDGRHDQRPVGRPRRIDHPLLRNRARRTAVACCCRSISPTSAAAKRRVTVNSLTADQFTARADDPRPRPGHPARGRDGSPPTMAAGTLYATPSERSRCYESRQPRRSSCPPTSRPASASVARPPANGSACARRAFRARFRRRLFRRCSTVVECVSARGRGLAAAALSARRTLAARAAALALLACWPSSAPARRSTSSPPGASCMQGRHRAADLHQLAFQAIESAALRASCRRHGRHPLTLDRRTARRLSPLWPRARPLALPRPAACAALRRRRRAGRGDAGPALARGRDGTSRSTAAPPRRRSPQTPRLCRTAARLRRGVHEPTSRQQARSLKRRAAGRADRGAAALDRFHDCGAATARGPASADRALTADRPPDLALRFEDQADGGVPCATRATARSSTRSRPAPTASCAPRCAAWRASANARARRRRRRSADALERRHAVARGPGDRPARRPRRLRADQRRRLRPTVPGHGGSVQ